jgi:hypothetical protein
VFEFISKSAANLTDHNVTATFQRVLRNTLKECKTLIGTENKGKFITLTPKPPNLRGLIKVHKTNTPIRPIVNFKNAPSYKLAAMFTNILQSYIPLPNVYNV